MEDLKFERFTKIGGRFSNKISLNKAGGFGFSSGFFKKNNISKYPYVIIFYSKRPMAVGFSFSKEPKEGAFKITFSNSNTASVSPNSFMRAYEINAKDYYGKYEPHQQKINEGENVFYILLEKKNKD
ncbi:MAG: hypothetical protein A3D44_03170 [Candidatus Staskawiczbacteria bacterium RIFCSPHIGHO2_02_FULL_42_22]|uniref:Uncharacterized protein n=1 Tax=Candidatus Staskawiczbacteria bacterium RIFCSPHIGHO2_02_FULL_42_22 TaxID=1802207 RepID=A0A1G2I4X9_9BACT|nr:MAG: hypothetical protein A3D44_03170 [Candidatus Staskawiczbacteria bacterium RIFCSPHIGHO2_02_FULL_42_22]